MFALSIHFVKQTKLSNPSSIKISRGPQTKGYKRQVSSGRGFKDLRFDLYVR